MGFDFNHGAAAMPPVTPKKAAPDDPRIAVDLAVKLRQGEISFKEIPEGLKAKVHAVPESELLKHAISRSAVRRFRHLNRPPAARVR